MIQLRFFPAIAIVYGSLISNSFAQIRTIALSGDNAPGLPVGAHFNAFTSPPVLNNFGEVAFIGSTTGTVSTGVWSEGTHSGLQLLARSATAAPGTPSGVNFSSFRNLVINNPGQVAVEAVVSGTGITTSNDVGLWISNSGGNLNMVAREGSQLPGLPSGVVLSEFMGNVFGTPAPPILNDAGQTAFRGKLAGPGVSSATNNDKGLWYGTTSGLTAILISRDTTTGSASGNDFIGFGQPILNNNGLVAFEANLAPNGFVNGPYLNDPTSGLSYVTRTDTPLPDGNNFTNLINPPKTNDAGDVAFWAIRTDGPSSSRMGVWVHRHGLQLAPVAEKGNQAPGTLPGTSFDFFFRPALNDAGNVAFNATLSGPGVIGSNNSGIWAETSAGLSLIARTGDLAPVIGLPFSSLSSTPTFNGHGQVAFTATAGNTGIWATDASGVLRLIVAPNSIIDVLNGPGVDLRTVSSVSMIQIDDFNGPSGNEDGLASGFNDLGQVAFSAVFTDGTRGVFVSDVATVPEPGCACLLLSVALLTFAIARSSKKPNG